MGDIKKYIFVSLLLIFLAIIFFSFFNQKTTLNVFCLTKSDFSIFESKASYTIYQEISEGLKDNAVQVGFTSEAVLSEGEFQELIPSIDRDKYDLFFLDLGYSDRFLNLQRMNEIESLFVTLFFEKSELLNNSINLMPDLNQISLALNRFCNLNEDSITLIIDEYQTEFDFSSRINGKVRSYPFNPAENFKDSINEIIDMIETYDPDYIVLNTNKFDTISILDSIVGYPREKIFLLLQNTNKETVYYTGANSYGVNGITVSKEFDSPVFDNERELYRMFSASVADFIREYGRFDKAEWIYFQNEQNGDFFTINDEDQVIMNLYHVKFGKNGLYTVE
ncbi:MAG TPA: hypothetical protein PK466_00610 [Thermotogota bacterium]|nr:hypothetical protein [Thermotogota bacterium]